MVGKECILMDKQLSNKYKFWYLDVDIYTDLLKDKEPRVREIFNNNIENYYKFTNSMKSQTMVLYLNELFSQQEKGSGFKEFYEQYKLNFLSSKEKRKEFFDNFPGLFGLIYDFYDQQLSAIENILEVIDKNKVELQERFNITKFEIKRMDRLH